MAVPMLDASTLQRTFTRSDARDAVRSALLSLATGAATVPDEIAFALPDGEIHVKGAYLGGAGSVAFKVASGFPGNPARGVPANGGFSVALDPITGLVKAFLLDGGWLTDMRTAAAAAVAADLLARADSHSVALIGTGAQAAFQLAALRDVRDIQRVRVWNRHADRAAEFADAHSSSTLLVEAASTVEEAVAGADIVVTLTASRSPLVRADWLRPGTHVTAVGADMVGKQELSVDVLERADVLVADSVAACSLVGELQHVGEIFDLGRVIEFPDLVAGTAVGRTAPQQITITDQCGLGAYDAAMVDAALRRTGSTTAVTS